MNFNQGIINHPKFHGYQILTRSWVVDQPKANIVIIHGLGEHSGRYAETALHLNRAGYNVFAFDRKGEGQSDGKKAYIPNAKDQLQIIEEYIKHLNLSSLPSFLFGHSLGGLLAVKYILNHPNHNFKGLVLSGPLLKVSDEVSPVLQKLAPVVGTLLPWLPTVKVNPDFVSQLEEERAKYKEDPLVFHGATSAATGKAIMSTIKDVQSNFESIQIPVLIMHGGNDKLSDCKGSKLMYDSIRSEDKTIKIFDGMYHEIMREPCKEEFFSTMVNWVGRRI